MKTYFVLVALLIAGTALKSQPDSLLNKMAGKWVLQGTIGGRETTHDVEGKRVLNGQYLQLTETSREKDAHGNPAYEAIVYLCWQEARRAYFCLWLDNTSNEGISNQVVARAKQNSDTIALVFAFSSGTRFYTTFIYDRVNDTWQWLMDGEDNNQLQPFARVKLVKRHF